MRTSSPFSVQGKWPELCCKRMFWRTYKGFCKNCLHSKQQGRKPTKKDTTLQEEGIEQKLRKVCAKKNPGCFFFPKLNRRTCIVGSRLRQMTRSKAVSNVTQRISVNPRRPVLKILALCLRILIFPHVFVYSSVRAGLVVVVVWWLLLVLVLLLVCRGGCGFSRSKEPSKRHYQRQLRPHKQRHTTDKPSITKLAATRHAGKAGGFSLVYYKPIFLGCVEEQAVASVRVANPRFDFNGRVGRSGSHKPWVWESRRIQVADNWTIRAVPWKPAERSAGTQKTKKHTTFSNWWVRWFIHSIFCLCYIEN